MDDAKPQFSWYLDITPNEMFSIDEYSIIGERGTSIMLATWPAA
jgi:hypothetical protein